MKNSTGNRREIKGVIQTLKVTFSGNRREIKEGYEKQ